MRPVRLPPDAVRLLGSPREWGIPHAFVGKAYHSRERSTITCILPRGSDKCRFETRPLIMDGSERLWLPQTYVSTALKPAEREARIRRLLDRASDLLSPASHHIEDVAALAGDVRAWAGRSASR